MIEGKKVDSHFKAFAAPRAFSALAAPAENLDSRAREEGLAFFSGLKRNEATRLAMFFKVHLHSPCSDRKILSHCVATIYTF